MKSTNWILFFFKHGSFKQALILSSKKRETGSNCQLSGVRKIYAHPLRSVQPTLRTLVPYNKGHWYSKNVVLFFIMLVFSFRHWLCLNKMKRNHRYYTWGQNLPFWLIFGCFGTGFYFLLSYSLASCFDFAWMKWREIIQTYWSSGAQLSILAIHSALLFIVLVSKLLALIVLE